MDLVQAAGPHAVRTIVGRLADDARRWARPALGAYDPVLAERIASVVVALAPTLSPARQATLVRYSLWCILLDDQLDEDPRPKSQPDDANRFLGRGLADLLARLATYDPGCRLVRRLTAALCDAV